MRHLFITLIAALPLTSISLARTMKEAPELGKIFEAQGVTGTFVLFDVEADTMQVWNVARAKKRFVPASTFKIPNSLIGLETGAVKDVDEVLPYGGKPQRLKSWEKDMSLREAIKVSNVPVYQELARRIGRERMNERLTKLGFGSTEIGEVVDQFWLKGPLTISAIEQTDFLARLAAGKLPVSRTATEAVKEITLLEKTNAYALHAKTGWYSSEGEKDAIGWWVGWVEREGKVYSFAVNIDMARESDAAKRISIGKECLKALGKI